MLDFGTQSISALTFLLIRGWPLYAHSLMSQKSKKWCITFSIKKATGFPMVFSLEFLYKFFTAQPLMLH